MMLIRLIAIDSARILTRARLWVVVAVVAAFGAWGVMNERRLALPDGTTMTAWLALADGMRVMSILPLAVAFGAGDVFARDRQTRYVALMLSRGAGRRMVVAAMLGGLGVVSVAAVALVTGVLAAVAFVLFPSAVPTGTREVYPFLPDLLGTMPPLHTVALWAVYSLSCLGVLGVSLAIGAVARNPIVASAIPPVGVLLAGLALPQALQWLNPLERMMFANTWQAAWTAPQNMAAYWAVVIVSSALFATVWFVRTDDL